MTSDERAANEPDWNRDQCTSWCTDAGHNSDPACWGGDSSMWVVPLSLEDGFPREVARPFDPAWLMDTEDPPRVGLYQYREQPGYQEVVYLHVYRPTENEHTFLDASVHLTIDEARQLADHLYAVADRLALASRDDGRG